MNSSSDSLRHQNRSSETIDNDRDSDILDSDSEIDDADESFQHSGNEEKIKMDEDQDDYVKFVQSIFSDFPPDNEDDEEEEYIPDSESEDEDDEDELDESNTTRVPKREVQDLLDDCWQAIVSDDFSLPFPNDSSLIVSGITNNNYSNFEYPETQSDLLATSSDFFNKDSSISLIPSSANLETGSQTKPRSLLSSVLGQMLSSEKASEEFSLSIGGQSLSLLRQQVYRQLSMSVQLILQMLILCDEHSPVFTYCFSNLVHLNSLRNKAVRKAALLDLHAQNMTTYQESIRINPSSFPSSELRKVPLESEDSLNPSSSSYCPTHSMASRPLTRSHLSSVSTISPASSSSPTSTISESFPSSLYEISSQFRPHSLSSTFNSNCRGPTTSSSFDSSPFPLNSLAGTTSSLNSTQPSSLSTSVLDLPILTQLSTVFEVIDEGRIILHLLDDPSSSSLSSVGNKNQTMKEIEGKILGSGGSEIEEETKKEWFQFLDRFDRVFGRVGGRNFNGKQLPRSDQHYSTISPSISSSAGHLKLMKKRLKVMSNTLQKLSSSLSPSHSSLPSSTSSISSSPSSSSVTSQHHLPTRIWRCLLSNNNNLFSSIDSENGSEDDDEEEEEICVEDKEENTLEKIQSDGSRITKKLKIGNGGESIENQFPSSSDFTLGEDDLILRGLIELGRSNNLPYNSSRKSHTRKSTPSTPSSSSSTSSPTGIDLSSYDWSLLQREYLPSKSDQQIKERVSQLISAATFQAAYHFISQHATSTTPIPSSISSHSDSETPSSSSSSPSSIYQLPSEIELRKKFKKENLHQQSILRFQQWLEMEREKINCKPFQFSNTLHSLPLSSTASVLESEDKEKERQSSPWSLSEDLLLLRGVQVFGMGGRQKGTEVEIEMEMEEEKGPLKSFSLVSQHFLPSKSARELKMRWDTLKSLSKEKNQEENSKQPQKQHQKEINQNLSFKPKTPSQTPLSSDSHLLLSLLHTNLNTHPSDHVISKGACPSSSSTSSLITQISSLISPPIVKKVKHWIKSTSFTSLSTSTSSTHPVSSSSPPAISTSDFEFESFPSNSTNHHMSQSLSSRPPFPPTHKTLSSPPPASPTISPSPLPENSAATSPLPLSLPIRLNPKLCPPHLSRTLGTNYILSKPSSPSSPRVPISSSSESVLKTSNTTSTSSSSSISSPLSISSLNPSSSNNSSRDLNSIQNTNQIHPSTPTISSTLTPSSTTTPSTATASPSFSSLLLKKALPSSLIPPHQIHHYHQTENKPSSTSPPTVTPKLPPPIPSPNSPTNSNSISDSVHPIPPSPSPLQPPLLSPPPLPSIDLLLSSQSQREELMKQQLLEAQLRQKQRQQEKLAEKTNQKLLLKEFKKQQKLNDKKSHHPLHPSTITTSNPSPYHLPLDSSDSLLYPPVPVPVSLPLSFSPLSSSSSNSLDGFPLPLRPSFSPSVTSSTSISQLSLPSFQISHNQPEKQVRKRKTLISSSTPTSASSSSSTSPLSLLDQLQFPSPLNPSSSPSSSSSSITAVSSMSDPDLSISTQNNKHPPQKSRQHKKARQPPTQNKQGNQNKEGKKNESKENMKEKEIENFEEDGTEDDFQLFQFQYSNLGFSNFPHSNSSSSSSSSSTSSPLFPAISDSFLLPPTLHSFPLAPSSSPSSSSSSSSTTAASTTTSLPFSSFSLLSSSTHSLLPPSTHFPSSSPSPSPSSLPNNSTHLNSASLSAAPPSSPTPSPTPPSPSLIPSLPTHQCNDGENADDAELEASNAALLLSTLSSLPPVSTHNPPPPQPLSLPPPLLPSTQSLSQSNASVSHISRSKNNSCSSRGSTRGEGHSQNDSKQSSSFSFDSSLGLFGNVMNFANSSPEN